MRPALFFKKIGMLALLAFCYGPAAIFAPAPRPREVQGIIRALDHRKHSLVLDCGRDRRRRTLTWKSDTSFTYAGKVVPARFLREGAAVRVDYRSRIFGKSCATRVACLDDCQKLSIIFLVDDLTG